MEFAANQSNIDNMVQEQVEQSQEVQEAQAALDEQNAEMAAPVPPIGTDVDNSKKELPSTQITPEMKVLKLATLAMLFKKVQQEKVQTILNKIEENDANSVLKFMNIEDLYAKVDPSQAMQYLQEIKKVLPRTRSKITKSYVLERMQNISQYFDKSQIEQKLRLERGKVKRFAFTALEGEYYDIPPLVANVIATYIEDGV